MQCGEINAFYDPANSSINLCYEFVADIEDRAPRATTPEGITRDEVVVGQIVGTLLHEGGHAISNLLRLPVLGREEDTADQIAAFVMLQFGRDIARTLIKGETFGWNQRQRTASRFWGPHSTALQRQHTFLCLAYGSDPQGFEDFVTKFRWLPKARADNCANEYQQVLHAFRETIVPHLDMALVKQMREKPLTFPMPARSRRSCPHRSDAIAFCRRAAVSAEADVIMPITLSTSGPVTGATSSLALAPSARNCWSVASAANAVRSAATRSAGTPGGASIGRATVFCVR